MSINFKRIADVPVIETISEGDTLLVNNNGEAKQIDASKVGGDSLFGSKTTKYTYEDDKNWYEDQLFDGYQQYWLLVPGKFDGSTLIGSSYTYTWDSWDEETEQEVTITETVVTDSSMYEVREINGLKYEKLGDLCILQDGAYSLGEWGIHASAGIYLEHSGQVKNIKEFILSENTKIDEKYIPDTIARLSQIPEAPQSNWLIFDQDDGAYIMNRPCYYTGVKLAGENITVYGSGNSHFHGIYSDYNFAKNAMYHVEGSLTVRWEDGSIQTEIISLEAEEDYAYYDDRGLPFTITITKHDDEEVSFNIEGIVNASKDITHSGFEGGLVYTSYHYATITNLNIHAYALKQLDDMVIPDTIQRVGGDVIINSSTEGSTKKFKIMVDDNGNLTATEVE